MTDSDDSDKLDRLLLRDAQSPLADEDFTARVMGALPAHADAVAPRPWLTPALVLGSAALGSFLAWLFAPEGSNAVQGFFDLAVLRSLTPAAITCLAMTAALLVSAIVLAADTE
jgi:hypothetical protein